MSPLKATARGHSFIGIMNVVGSLMQNQMRGNLEVHCRVDNNAASAITVPFVSADANLGGKLQLA